MTSLQWKRFYATERDALSPSALDFLLDLDHPQFPEGGALVFPHTRLQPSIGQIAPAVLSVLYSRAKHVLALAPLHGGRQQDHELLSLARSGDPGALAYARAVHSGDDDIARDEFSLDTFEYLLHQFARRLDLPLPQVHRKHPYLTLGPATSPPLAPNDLPGYRGLKRLLDQGAALVVSADPIHHGYGYLPRGTKEGASRPAARSDTHDWASGQIFHGFSLLQSKSYADFRSHATDINSDFRDTGPLMAELLAPGWSPTLHSLSLVDYAKVLGAKAPTWVASALVTVSHSC